ncbi:MAG: MGMT family protein, partial [Proteobacteria bacterium]|nr:MGMT family protein [Pseudomonadota bacterium]
MVQNFRQRVYAVVRKIPKGKVATYGQVARLAGAPAAARQVGYALAAINGLLPPTCKTPWQRVVNRLGEISYSLSRGGGDDLQRVMLEDEGVVFDKDGKIE